MLPTRLYRLLRAFCLLGLCLPLTVASFSPAPAYAAELSTDEFPFSDLPSGSDVPLPPPPPLSGGLRQQSASPQGPTSSVLRPFANDPLGIVAHYGLATPPPVWVVFACDTPELHYVPNPSAAITSGWGPWVIEWFQWASGGRYTPTFEVGPTVSGSTLQACTSAATSALLPSQRKSGAAVIVLSDVEKSRHDTGFNGAAKGWGLGRGFLVSGQGNSAVAYPDNMTPFVQLQGDAIDEKSRASLLVHEMGHVVGWHHLPYAHSSTPYSFPGDVMSGIQYAPTHVFNRYRVGWLNPSRVLFHTSSTQTLRLGAPNSGLPEMLVLADPSAPGRLYALGLNPGSDYPAFSRINTDTGIDVLVVDQTATSRYARPYRNFCPQTPDGLGMCSLLAVSTDIQAPKKTGDFESFTLRPGATTTIAGVTVEVLSQDSSGFSLRLSGSPTPFWPRDLKLSNPAGAFFDVPPTHTFFDAINALADLEITKGCNPPANNRFCPSDPVTRGQMAAFLSRLLRLPAADSDDVFADTVDHIFADSAARLRAAGITKGCNPPANDRFCPDRPITRGEMAAFLTRALGLSAPLTTFSDAPPSHIFSSAIAALADAGITKGCNPPANDRFCPDRPITRGEMAAFLIRARTHL